LSQTQFRSTVLLALFGAMFAAIGLSGTAAGQRIAGPTPIEVDATPITVFEPRNASQKRFGALEFRGGLVLNSKAKTFGGFSSLYVEPDGSHFVSASDRGTWLRGRIVYRDGRPDSIADAETAPILGPDGRSIESRGWFDAESLTQRDGALYVGLERVEQILRFDYKRDGLMARGEPQPVPPDFKTLRNNQSLECLAAPPKGSLHDDKIIVVTEESLDDAGNHRSFLLKGTDVSRFTVKRHDDFDISDCVMMPPDNLLLLERRFALFRGGLAMRIRQVPLASIKPGALVDGKNLIEADLGYEIDNMEGIGLHRNASGETILTLISDDNFLPFQRTLLLQFALVGD
jgi:hypothetical protein